MRLGPGGEQSSAIFIDPELDSVVSWRRASSRDGDLQIKVALAGPSVPDEASAAWTCCCCGSVVTAPNEAWKLGWVTPLSMKVQVWLATAVSSDG